jgi:hypothetical protein
VKKAIVAALATLALAVPAAARAHCDTLDGPVVEAAREALRSGDARPVLAWVRKGDEGELKDALARAVAVRKAGGEAQKLADTWFFETLVRVHRAGEGAPYTGLKPAGQDLGPAIPAADAALETGKPQALVRMLSEAQHDGLHERWARAVEARRHRGESVEAGRRYVAAYVDYVHHVERLHAAATAGGHHGEAAHAGAPAHAH